MKKILTLAITAMLVLSLAGCNNNSGKTDTTTASEPKADVTTTAAPQDDVTTTEAPQDEATTTEAPAADVMDEASAKTIAEDLLTKHEIISSVLLKAGYLADYDAKISIEDGDMVWDFAPITDDRCTFTSVNDIKAYVESTYTDNYDSFSNTSMYLYDNGNASMFIDYEGQLLINVTGGGGGGNNWAYDTLSIASITDEEIVGSCDGQTSYEEPAHIDFSLKLDNGTWKIDTTASL